MENPQYIQIFSITDHSQPLQGRYQGPYAGINADLHTSGWSDKSLLISKSVKGEHGFRTPFEFKSAKLILAYRHSDTGILQGTSENLFGIDETPWEKMPGLRIDEDDSAQVILRMWNQDMKPEAGKLFRIRFGKTLVYVKNFGRPEKLEWIESALESGPSSLHASNIDQDITIAPDAGSGLQIKMGQEIQNP